MDTDTFIVRIDSLSYGGRGVARRQDGKVVFVPAVLPGETVRVRADKETSSYCIAEVEEILERSPDRVDPVCRFFSVCGGCDWQHIPYPAQVGWKNTILEAEVVRAGGPGGHHMHSPVASPKAFGYRGHAIFQCAAGPEVSIGFFQKKSNSIVEFDACPVLNRRVQEIVDAVRAILRTNPVPGLHSLEIHAPQDEAILLAGCRGSDQKKIIRAMEAMYHKLDISGISFVTHGHRRGDHVLGQRFCRYSLSIHGEKIDLSGSFGGFIQANIEVNTALIEHVADLAKGSREVLDLYGGSGNFSIPLSRSAGRVTVIEKSNRLVSQGKISARKNRAGNVRFLAMDAFKAVSSIRDELVEFDTIVLDPPREGAKDVAKVLPDLNPSRILYISCNPSTLARDLRPLIEVGYALKSLRAFDMFPQTYHIESVAYLER